MKVILKKTKKIIDVTNNVAHGMIERGEAKLFKYKNKQMRPKTEKPKRTRKRYRTK